MAWKKGYKAKRSKNGSLKMAPYKRPDSMGETQAIPVVITEPKPSVTFTAAERKAIQRIAQKPVETKSNSQAIDLATYLTSVTQANNIASTGIRFHDNFISRILSQSNTSTGYGDGQQNKFLGDEIQLRGLRWEGFFYTPNSVISGAGVENPGGQYDYWLRFTVYRVNAYGFATGVPASNTLEDDAYLTPTLSRWNREYVDVIFERRFKLDNNGNLNALVHRKFWIPIQRKVEKAVPGANPGTADVMGEIKGMQYYWCLEAFSPGNGAIISVDLVGNIQYTTYFKDA